MSARSFVMAAVVGIAVVVLTPAAVLASRIDVDGQDGSHGEWAIDVWFDCGIACGNYFDDIKPGSPVSRPGKAGKVQAQGRDIPQGGGGACEAGNRVSVGAHGEVGVSLSGPSSDGFTFTWVSKGGNSWTSPVAHAGDIAAKGSDPCNWRGSP